MNLTAMFTKCLRRVRAKHILQLEQAGVPRAAMVGPLPPLYGVHPITARADGTFELAEGGPAAVVVVVGKHYGRTWWERIDDLCAFYPANPYRWWVLRDVCDILGEEYVEEAITYLGRVQLVASPLEWLVRGGAAACILDWSCDPRRLFLGASAVECASEAVAARVADRIAELSAPSFSITVEVPEGVAA